MSNTKVTVCCVFCGRDTNSRDGVCYRCHGGNWSQPKQNRRKPLTTTTFTDSPIETVGDREDVYHGDIYRDDM